MSKPLMLLSLALLSSNAAAVDAGQLMPELTWDKRVLLVFVPRADHPKVLAQEAMLNANADGLAERHMTVIRVFADGRVAVDTTEHDRSAETFYRRFGISDDAFRVVLVGKDGGVKLESGDVVSRDELFSLIDAMPMRRYEMQQNG